jgi:hypothetical protein
MPGDLVNLLADLKKEYLKLTRANAYGKDAIATVYLAKKWLGVN